MSLLQFAPSGLDQEAREQSGTSAARRAARSVAKACGGMALLAGLATVFGVNLWWPFYAVVGGWLAISALQGGFFSVEYRVCLAGLYLSVCLVVAVATAAQAETLLTPEHKAFLEAVYPWALGLFFAFVAVLTAALPWFRLDAGDCARVLFFEALFITGNLLAARLAGLGFLYVTGYISSRLDWVTFAAAAFTLVFEGGRANAELLCAVFPNLCPCAAPSLPENADAAPVPQDNIMY